jgi:hypothetical protein
VLRFIRHTRALSLFTLLMMLGSVPIGVTALVLDRADDTDGGPLLVLHDHSAHRIGVARTTAPEPEHCLVCHWLHSLQTMVASSGVSAPPADCRRLLVAALVFADPTATAILAARAPPSTL